MQLDYPSQEEGKVPDKRKMGSVEEPRKRTVVSDTGGEKPFHDLHSMQSKLRQFCNSGQPTGQRLFSCIARPRCLPWPLKSSTHTAMPGMLADHRATLTGKGKPVKVQNWHFRSTPDCCQLAWPFQLYTTLAGPTTYISGI
jgi:hypothetical protein